ncbi:MAG: DNA translocase FtsK 4TM domain-containing protein, partial [Acidimicrobiia bacterium]|nr:DNA translocase FtsK 4TM domain-containing protein [Acidimicrobiia bacterium]
MSSRTSKARGAKGRKARTTSQAGVLSRARAALVRWRDRVRNRLGRQSDDVWGLILVVAAALVLLSFFELAGPIGRGVSSFLELLFGVWGYLVPVALAAVGVLLLSAMPRKDHVRLAIGITTVFVGTLTLFHLLTGAISLADNVDRVREHGGAVGAIVAFPLRRLIGFWGTFVVLTTVIGAGVLIITRTTVKEVWITIVTWVRRFVRWARSVRLPKREPAPIITEPIVEMAESVAAPAAEKSPPKKARPKGSKPPASKPAATKPPKTPPAGVYSLPPIDLLNIGDAGDQNRRSLEQTAAELEEALRQHGVDARLTRIAPGPTVTRYEIELAPGVKVSRVTGLSSDIAY